MDSATSTAMGNSVGIDHQQLEQLQGLHLPQAIGWWPLAPGWWLLAIILLLTLLFVFINALKRRRHPKDHTHWLTQVNQCYDDWLNHRQSTKYLQRINRLLRVQAMQISGRCSVARLSGTDWLDYLSETAAVAPSDELTHLLSEACYQHTVAVEVDQVHQDIMQLARGLTHAQAIRSTNTITSTSR